MNCKARIRGKDGDITVHGYVSHYYEPDGKWWQADVVDAYDEDGEIVSLNYTQEQEAESALIEAYENGLSKELPPWV